MEDKFKHYTEVCYNGRNLVAQYSLHAEGVWDVYGEDDNAGLSGYHSDPFLGTYSGKLEDVLRHVVELNGFWAWGGGGRIVENKPKKITHIDSSSNKRRKELQDLISSAKLNLSALESELNSIS